MLFALVLALALFIYFCLWSVKDLREQNLREKKLREKKLREEKLREQEWWEERRQKNLAETQVFRDIERAKRERSGGSIGGSKGVSRQVPQREPYTYIGRRGGRYQLVKSKKTGQFYRRYF